MKNIIAICFSLFVFLLACKNDAGKNLKTTAPAVLADTIAKNKVEKEILPCCDSFAPRWDSPNLLKSPVPLSEMEGEQLQTVSTALHNLKRKVADIRKNEARRRAFGFPDNCIFYEYAELRTPRLRALAIVIEDARFTIDLDEFYTCPAEVTGHGYVCGLVRFVLLDTRNKTVLDTVSNLEFETFAPPFCKNLPFSICRGYSYRSDGDAEREGLARILSFSDFDGDGLAAEFPIFEHGACGWKEAAIIGYDAKTDALQNLSYDFQVTEEDWENKRGGRDTMYRAAYDWMPNLPLAALAREDTLQYAFFGGHGMETGEVFKIWRAESGAGFRGELRIVMEKNLFEKGGPWFGAGGGAGY